jgi:hypothetical protein
MAARELRCLSMAATELRCLSQLHNKEEAGVVHTDDKRQRRIRADSGGER